MNAGAVIAGRSRDDLAPSHIHRKFWRAKMKNVVSAMFVASVLGCRRSGRSGSTSDSGSAACHSARAACRSGRTACCPNTAAAGSGSASGAGESDDQRLYSERAGGWSRCHGVSGDGAEVRAGERKDGQWRSWQRGWDERDDRGGHGLSARRRGQDPLASSESSGRNHRTVQNSSASATGAANAAPGSAAAGATLKVDSVKMIAATCPQ